MTPIRLTLTGLVCLLSFIALIGPAKLLASPALLGIEPGVTTVGELRKIYAGAEMIAPQTKEFGGPIYRVDGPETGAEGVIEARFIFNRNGVPVAITGVFEADRFDHINLILGTKYRLLTHSNRPLARHGQERYVWYDAGDTLISMTTPKDSERTYVTYADQRTRNKIEASLTGLAQ